MTENVKEIQERLRNLPAMHLLLEEIKRKDVYREIPYPLIKKAAELVLESMRKRILRGERVAAMEMEDIVKEVKKRARDLHQPNLRPVVNASGTIIHTNLGRSVLADQAISSLMEIASRYSNLEYDLERGERGSRYVHIIEILKDLTGAEDAMVVNNNAAAVLLVLNTFARGREVIVSRGEMIEIGGSFRIPEVMKASGAHLVEVGATNKTYLTDYREAITENTAMLLKAHTSNYRVVGFTASVDIEDLVFLAEEEGLVIFEDLGSGVIIDLSPFGIDDEPTVARSIEAGVHLVSFSGDKLLGGPQAGIIVGKEKYIQPLKKNQLTRALRVDKFTLAALEATLALYLEPQEAVKAIPTLKMLVMDPEEILSRARALLESLKSILGEKVPLEIIKGTSTTGGGALPLKELPTYLVSLKPEDVTGWEYALRMGDPPVIARIKKERLLFDCRTLLAGDIDRITKRIKEIDMES